MFQHYLRKEQHLTIIRYIIAPPDGAGRYKGSHIFILLKKNGGGGDRKIRVNDERGGGEGGGKGGGQNIYVIDLKEEEGGNIDDLLQLLWETKARQTCSFREAAKKQS